MGYSMHRLADLVSAITMLACIIGLAPSAEAAIVLATDRASMAGADSLDWGTLGPDHINLTNPFTITSAGGLDVSVSQVAEFATVVTQGKSWNGAFSPGERALWDLWGGPMTLDFGALLDNFGLQIHTTFWGDFTARLEALDSLGNVLGSVARDGISSNAGDGSAIFIGVVSDSSATNFSRIRVSLVAGPFGDLRSFAVNRADFTVAQASVVPEPGALALAGIGILTIAGTRLGRKVSRRGG